MLVRDSGLLPAALARPQASAFGADAYATLNEKAAALLHSLARNHALVDGNKRRALASTIALIGINGRRLTITHDQRMSWRWPSQQVIWMMSLRSPVASNGEPALGRWVAVRMSRASVRRIEAPRRKHMRCS